MTDSILREIGQALKRLLGPIDRDPIILTSLLNLVILSLSSQKVKDSLTSLLSQLKGSLHSFSARTSFPSAGAIFRLPLAIKGWMKTKSRGLEHRTNLEKEKWKSRPTRILYPRVRTVERDERSYQRNTLTEWENSKRLNLKNANGLFILKWIKYWHIEKELQFATIDEISRNGGK